MRNVELSAVTVHTGLLIALENFQSNIDFSSGFKNLLALHISLLKICLLIINRFIIPYQFKLLFY